MPVKCKNPKYGYTKKRDVRLTFCNGKVVESKRKIIVDFERKYKKTIYTGKKGGYYYIKKGNKIYVR